MYKIIGVQSVDYTNKMGKRVRGFRLHTTFEDNRVNGLACEVVYVPVSSLSFEPKVGQVIDVLYNKYGSVSRVLLGDSKTL